MSFVMSSRAKRNPFHLHGSETLRGTRANYFCLLPVAEPGQTGIGFHYAFCGAILCDVDESTSSIVVPVDRPCFEYPHACFRANGMRRNCVPLRCAAPR